ncbi:MAG: cysteine--tRNA ligase, partial [Candidatus Zambryskibacteria bacterium]|nr:cysteine--tRNA ligase [Candidatus Zambryskibacteria bacterium]
KMAKSEGNFLTLNSIVGKSFSPLAYRYFLMLAHYRSRVIFSWEALEAANNAFEKLKSFVSRTVLDTNAGGVDLAYKAKFMEKMENDLNTPQALAVLWTLVKDKEVTLEDKLATILEFDKVLGLGLK